MRGAFVIGSESNISPKYLFFNKGYMDLQSLSEVWREKENSRNENENLLIVIHFKKCRMRIQKLSSFWMKVYG